MHTGKNISYSNKFFSKGMSTSVSVKILEKYRIISMSKNTIKLFAKAIFNINIFFLLTFTSFITLNKSEMNILTFLMLLSKFLKPPSHSIFSGNSI